jgi:hypothetical protein
VPDRPTGPADRASARVVRGWLRALSRGDVQRAARFFALPSRYQNGTAVLTIDSPGERLAINLALPCGGRVVALRGARGFAIATIRLRERPGADCGKGTGGRASASGTGCPTGRAAGRPRRPPRRAPSPERAGAHAQPIDAPACQPAPPRTVRTSGGPHDEPTHVRTLAGRGWCAASLRRAAVPLQAIARLLPEPGGQA